MPATGAAGDLAATCGFVSSGRSYLAGVMPTDEIVTARKPYDEGPAAAFSVLDGRKATLRGETGLRPIEAVTALAVHLHKTALPPPTGRRWMLGQMTVHRALAQTESRDLTLEIDKVLGSAMTRTRMSAGDGALGAMIFILAGSTP